MLTLSDFSIPNMLLRFNGLGKFLGFVSPSGKNTFIGGQFSLVTESRDLTPDDVDIIQRSNSSSAVALTIPQDTVLGITGNEAASLSFYMGGTGAISFVAGSGVTVRGTPPTVEQYGLLFLFRIGTNEWSY
jgi:hypothetical protein